VGHIVIAAYRPKQGMERELLELTREHHGILDAEGLVTDRRPVIATAKDGTIVEVFEWKSTDAVASAHENPAVLKLWERYAAVSEYVPLTQLAESSDLFAGFESAN
jgi:hypothetical protein